MQKQVTECVVSRLNECPPTYCKYCVHLLLAVCFKNAKQYEQAKDAYLKEAEYHTENKAYPISDLSRVDCHDIWLFFSSLFL